MSKPNPNVGIVGTHVSQSLSPVIHNAAYAEMGRTDLNYGVFELPEFPGTATEERRHYLGEFLAQQALDGVVGMSVTMPFKLDLMNCDHVSPGSSTTRRIGAANTLSHPDNGSWFPDNTDWLGAVESLHEADVSIDGRSALVLGGGGAAQSVAFGLAEAGADRITIANRTLANAEQIVEKLRHMYPDTHFCAVKLDKINDEKSAWTWVIEESDIVYNTTNIGQTNTPTQGQSPLTEKAIGRLKRGAAVADAVYMPIATPLLQMVGSRGDLQPIDGTRMLLHQAIPQIRTFTGEYDVPETAINFALQTEIRKRQIEARRTSENS